MQKDRTRWIRVIVVCLAVLGSAILAGEAVTRIASRDWIIAVAVVCALAIGALTIALLRALRIIGGAVLLIGVLPLPDFTTTALSRVPSHELTQWPRIIGMALLIPTFIGALAYCRLTNNWDAFKGQEDDAPEKE